MYGLRAQFGKDKGKLMRKSWMMACNRDDLGLAISRVCNHKSTDHVRVSGRNTAISESYPREFAKTLHRAFGRFLTVRHSHLFSLGEAAKVTIDIRPDAPPCAPVRCLALRCSMMDEDVDADYDDRRPSCWTRTQSVVGPS